MLACGTDTLAQQSSVSDQPEVQSTKPVTASQNGFYAVLAKDLGQISRVLPSFQFSDGPVIVTVVPVIFLADVATATPGFSNTGRPMVNIVLTPRGTINFAVFTAANIGKKLAIVVDDQVLSAPTITQAIFGGKIQINGNFTVEETTRLAKAIKAPS